MVEGIVRKLDELGRVCFPIEARRVLGLKEGSPVEIYVADGEFRVKPVITRCKCCGATGKETKLIEKNSVVICEKCISDFSKQVKVKKPD